MTATKRALEREAAKAAEATPEATSEETTQGSSGSGAITTEQPKATAKAPAKPKAPKAAKPTLDATTAKQLKELSVEIARLEGLKADRLTLIKQAHAAKAPTSEIASASGLSVPRLRQLIAAK
jgi:hypothetical protein